MAQSLEPLLRVRGIRKTYRSDGVSFAALRGVDLEIGAGELVALTGGSGCGKSTLLGVLGALLPPDGGAVELDGIDVYALDHEARADLRREYLGFVFQQFHLVPSLSALENVMLPLCVSRVPLAERAERAREALDRVGLAERARRLPSQLSGGEQQRVAIARALVNEPPLLLADEPTGNLDTRTGDEVFDLLRELHAAGETVLMVTHNPDLAGRAERVLRMRDGRLQEESPRRHLDALTPRSRAVEAAPFP